MTHKIIVADDSQTIQKVIKITFAQHEVELISCINEEELIDNMSEDISLVLLDFSLSETMSGYDLGKLVNDKYPDIPILGLLGTFDSVDDVQFKECGYIDKVIKPFETERFIAKCEYLLDNSHEDIDLEQEHEEDASDFSEWSVESSAKVDEELIEEDYVEELVEESVDEKDELEQELGGWGLDGPEIEESDVTNTYEEYPPVIEEGENIASKFLSADTLIEIDDRTREINHSELKEKLEELKDVDHIDDIEDLEDDEELQDELQTMTVESLNDDSSFDESEVVEEDLSEDKKTDEGSFWAVDEQEHQIEQEIEQEVEDLDDVDSSDSASDSFENEQVYTGDIKEDLRADLEPIVEKYVKKYCEDNLEKIIWEIVPDLAENLIKKELKHISKSVLDSVTNS